MKLLRAIATVLIFVMASGPALATVCATSCAAGAMMNSVASAQQDTSSTVGDHCHNGAADSSKHQPGKHQSNSEHKGCTMAAGCQFSLAVLLVPSSQPSFVDFTSTTLPRFDPSAVIPDLPPPLKPPA